MPAPKVNCIIPVPRPDHHHTDYALPGSFNVRETAAIKADLNRTFRGREFELENTTTQLVIRLEPADCIFEGDCPTLRALRSLFVNSSQCSFTAVVHQIRKSGGSFRVALHFLGKPSAQELMVAGTFLSRVEGVSDQEAHTSSKEIAFTVAGTPERSMNALLHRMLQVRIGAALLR